MARSTSSYGFVPESNLGVPSQIKCCRCSKVKGPGAFAKNRQQDLVNHIALKGPGYDASTRAYIACSECVGGQVTELFCIGCDKTKGLISFSKAQRRTPDKAKCWPCMQEQLNTEPGASSDDDDSAASNSDSDSDYSLTGGTTLGGMSNLTITDGATSETGGVSVASQTVSRASVTTPPHLRRANAAPSVSSGNSNFAKVRAVKRPVDMDAARREREREREQELDDVRVADSDSDDSD